MKVQFGRTNFIHKVEIYCRFYTNWYDPSSWCVENVDRFKGCVDAENNVDVSVYQGEEKQESCGTIQLTHGLERSDQIYTLICNTRGDEVRLSKNTGVIAVYEMVVIGTGKLRVLGLASAYHWHFHSHFKLKTCLHLQDPDFDLHRNLKLQFTQTHYCRTKYTESRNNPNKCNTRKHFPKQRRTLCSCTCYR